MRFESILSIENQASLAPFQDAIREHYPVLRASKGRTTIVNQANGSISFNSHAVWKFSDLNDKWRVSLAPTFIALETTDYRSRSEFIEKFAFILSALSTHFRPGVITRTGIRYIDRLKGDALGSIKNLVRTELLGVLSSDVETSLSAATSEALFLLDENRLFARWGSLPPNATTDPQMIKPDSNPSWVLDIDVSKSGGRPWQLSSLQSELNQLAEIGYNFFRWAVTDKFLTYFGGKP